MKNLDLDPADWYWSLMATEELRDLETQLLVQRTGVLAGLTGAVLLGLPQLLPAGAVVLEVLVATCGAIAAALAIPGTAEVVNRLAIWWTTRHYPLEGES